MRKYASTKVHDKELNSAAVTSESAVAFAESVSASLSSSTEASVLAVSSSAEASVTSIHSPSESEVITIPSPVELIDEIAGCVSTSVAPPVASTAMDVPTEPVPATAMPIKNVSTAICNPSEPVSTSIVANAKPVSMIIQAAAQPVCTSAAPSSMATSSRAPAETVSKSISEIAESISTSKSVPTLIAVSVQSGMTSSPTETVSTPADSPLSLKTKMLEAHQQFTRARHGLKLGTSRRFFRRRQPFQAMSMKIDRMEDTCARIEEKLDMLIKQCGPVGVQPADVKPLLCDDMKPVSPIVVTPFSSSSMPPLPPAHFPPAGMTSFTPSNDMSSWPPSTMAPLPSDEMTACSGADMTSWSPDTPLWGHSSVTPAPHNPTDNQSLEISAETLAHMSSHSYTNTPTQFAMRLMIHYFPDLFGADNRRFQYNVSGCRGKERLDPMRVNAIRRYVSMYFPEVADDRVWITKCVSSMNERLRRPSSRVSAGFPGSI